METTQNLIRRNFSCINNFYYELPVVVNVVHDLTVGVFKHIDITSKLIIYNRIKYIEIILTVTVLNKYRESLLACKETTKEFYGSHWTFGGARYVIIEDFGVWDKKDGLYADRGPIYKEDIYEYFEQEL